VGALLAASLAAGPAWSYGVQDPGTTGCKLFGRLYEKGPKGTEYQFLSYAQGYVAAKGGTATLEAAPTMKRLLAFCAAHPDAPFVAAVDDLWAAPAAPTKAEAEKS
jgi:hypothetical protein